MALPNQLFRAISAPLVEIDSQVLRQEVRLAGSAFSLCYRSDRVPGRKSAFTLVIPVLGGAVGRRVKEAILELHVAGSRIEARFEPKPHQSYAFRWDRRDARGGVASSPQPLTIRIGTVQRAFFPRPELTRWRERATAIGPIDARAAGLGGWTLTPHHIFDPLRHVLYLGDGSRRRARGTKQGAEIHVSSARGSETLIFDPAGRHLRTVDAIWGTRLFGFDYDASGRLVAITDAGGGVTRIEREGAGAAIVTPGGTRTLLALNAHGFLSDITNPAGHVVRFETTEDGLLAVLTDPNGNAYRFSYDEEGRLVRRDEPGGSFSSYASLRSEHSRSVAVLSALGRETIYERQRLPTGEELHRNSCCGGSVIETRIAADGARTVVEPDGTTTAVRSERETRTVETRTPGGLTRRVAQRRTATDGRVAADVEINGRKYSIVVDVRRREETKQAPGEGGTALRFDPEGHVVEKRVAGHHPISYSWERGRLTGVRWGPDDDARMTAFTYDENGRVRGITDALKRAARLEYDVAGMLVRQTTPGGAVIEYRYDANGNRLAVTPPGRPPHRFERTPVNLIAAVVAPGGATTAFRYDAEQRLVSVVRPSGATIENAYDPAGRLISVTTPDGVTRLTPDPKSGRIAAAASPGGTAVSFGFDGALLTRLSWEGAIRGEVARKYDNDFRLQALSVGGAEIDRQYGADGRLVRVGELRLGRDPVTGRVAETTFGRIVTRETTNGFGEMESFRAFAGQRELLGFRLSRDRLGRIVKKEESIEGQLRGFTYEYDSAGRLSGVVGDERVAARYEYDANGNRVRAGVRDAEYDDRDRLVRDGEVHYEHSANGERTRAAHGGESTAYEYDAFGNLVRVALAGGRVIDYALDAQGRRLLKKVDGRATQGLLYRDLIAPVAEIDENHRLKSRFVYAQRRHTPEYLWKDGAWYRILSDHLGSPRLIVNAADGAVVQRIDYSAFGEVVSDSSPGFQPFGFAGGLRDVDSGLVHFGMRDYDPRSGRWIAADPALFAGGDTNLYAYVFNDPVNLADPLGLWEGIWPGMGPAVHHDRNRFGGNICPPNMPDPYSGPRECPDKWKSTGWHQEPERSPTHGYNWSFRDESGSQCVYDGNGDLVTDPDNAGSYDYVSPFNPDGSMNWTGAAGHFFVDMLPWIMWGN